MIKDSTLETILSVLRGLGYSVQYKVLNAAYFGVGQKKRANCNSRYKKWC